MHLSLLYKMALTARGSTKNLVYPVLLFYKKYISPCSLYSFYFFYSLYSVYSLYSLYSLYS